MRRVLLAVAALAVLGACGDQNPTEPIRPTGGGSAGLLSSGPKLVECHTDESLSQTAIIDALGGTIALGGTSVVFPAGALLGPTTVTLTIPASRYVEIDIETDGQKEFLDELLRPIVTIDYSRCARSDVLWKPLSAWYIDSDTKELLENMLGVDNKLTRSVTFRTHHFSGYAIAF
jgi:hypothetical protein